MRSLAVAMRETLCPTVVSEGLTERPSTEGHTLTVPLTAMLPVFFGAEQVKLIRTDVVLPATTLNSAEPLQVRPAALESVALRVRVKPVPTGMPPMIASTTELFWTLMLPDF